MDNSDRIPVHAVLECLRLAGRPLTFQELTKRLPRPRKGKKAELDQALHSLLDEQIRLGSLHGEPSGSKGTTRYWTQDESAFLRQQILNRADAPLSLTALMRDIRTVLPGTDVRYVETVVGEMVQQKLLFVHPPTTRKGAVCYAIRPAPPPLERPGLQKKVDKWLWDAQGLLIASGASLEELIEFCRLRLRVLPSAGASKTVPETRTIEDRILEAVEKVPVVCLAELRRSLPPEWQGNLFDAAVLRLADQRRVIVGQDAHPARFTTDQLREFVQDGAGWLTTISKGE